MSIDTGTLWVGEGKDGHWMFFIVHLCFGWAGMGREWDWYLGYMGRGGGVGRVWVGKDLCYDGHGLSDMAKSTLFFTDPMISVNREYHQCSISEPDILISLTNSNG